MCPFEPLVHDLVGVTWNEDGTARRITYRSLPVKREVYLCIADADFAGLRDLVEDLLDALASLGTDNKRKIYLADRIFEALKMDAVVPDPKSRVELWKNLIEIVWKWEDSHEKVHKGTAYYWAAESYLSMGDVTSAYIFFFNALEDAKDNFPYIPKKLEEAPSYRTTSLVDSKDNALYLTVVVPLRMYLQSFIDSYNSRTGAHLDLPTLDRKFLQERNLEVEDIKRLFVATLHEAYHLSGLNSSRMVKNDFSKLKAINTFFNLGLIVDQTLAHRFLQNVSEGDRTMGKAVTALAQSFGLTDFLKKVHPSLKDLPDAVLPILLQGGATYDGSPLNEKLHSVLIALRLRNYGGHHLKGNNVFVKHYDAILSRMMDALFVAIESL